MAKRLVHKCPNCGEPVAGHPDTSCTLYGLMQIVRERGNLPEAKVQKIHREVDVDALWEELGPVIDRLEDGAFK
jgi:hypothetical protein